MAAKRGSIIGLKAFIPDNTFDFIYPYFEKYTIQLTVKPNRKSVFGDYINPTPSDPIHKISVNGDLNPYSFLVTLLHELAHLITFVQYQHTVSAHGKEWKNNFQNILIPFIQHQLLPKDISEALMQYIKNIKASTCGDVRLYKTLSRYDIKNNNLTFIDEVPNNATFILPSNGKKYKKLGLNRTRYKCLDISQNKVYLFSKVAQVQIINENN